MRVLLIVDLQRDFCPGGSLAVADGDRIVPMVNCLIGSGQYDKVVATMDWHPVDHCSFAPNHPGKAPFDQIEQNGTAQMLWPVHCVAETPGAELHP